MTSQKRLIEIDLLSDSEEIIPVKLAKKSEELARVESTSSSTVSASVLEQLMIGIRPLACLINSLIYLTSHSLTYSLSQGLNVQYVYQLKHIHMRYLLVDVHFVMFVSL